MRKAVIIGGGFIGLQEAILFAKHNYKVTIIDVNKKIVDSINSKDVANLHVREDYVVKNWDKIKNNIDATTDYSVLKDADVVVIAVNTPLKVFGKDLIDGLELSKEIDYFLDFTPLNAIVEELKKHLKNGVYINSLVTIYSGGTYELIVKPLIKAGFKLGQEVFVTHTPERLDPGSKFSPEEIPRNLGYIDKNSLEVGQSIYLGLGIKVFPAELDVVELSKLHENAFRLVNIAFVQESLIKHGEDIIKVVELAGTKPFGFLKFYPSPYAGGTCLVKDSIMYWYSTKNEIVKQALIINEKMPEKYAEILSRKIRNKGYRKILFYGLGFKPNIPYYITKELNPIERLIEELRKLNSSIEIKKFDPNLLEYSDFKDENKAVSWADVVIHWDYKRLLEI